MFNYPFIAILGNEKAKKALILLCINPKIGSVLLLGKKGDGKTILLQSMKELIKGKKRIDAAKSIDGKQMKVELPRELPCLDIPTNITLDRLLGGISFEDAIKSGEKKLEKGILSTADGGYLFLDQINLLPDGILNRIFSVQEKRNLVLEREGISHEEEIDFSFFAAMDPEEAELSGAQLDHIGISVALEDDSGDFFEETLSDESKTEKTKADRAVAEGAYTDNSRVHSLKAERMKRMMEFEHHPAAFCRKHEEDTNALRHRIEASRKRLPGISLSDKHYLLISNLVGVSGCSGHRGDIALCEAARAIAAFDGRYFVEESDLIEAAEYTLPHRMKRPGETVDFSSLLPEEKSGEVGVDEQNDSQHESVEAEGGVERKDSDISSSSSEIGERNEKVNQEDSNGNPKSTKKNDGIDADSERMNSFSNITILSKEGKKAKSLGYGRRRVLVSHLDRGREVGALIPKGRIQDLSMTATLRAAAMDHRPPNLKPNLNSKEPKKRQGTPDFVESTGGCDLDFSHSGPLLKIRSEHLREKKKESTGGARILFLVDGSASMGANKRMALVKRVVFSILGDSYVHRDFVAVMVFRGRESALILPFTRSMARARQCLENLRTGGRTPLIFGLQEALRCFRTDAIKNKNPRYELVLVSDGKNNVLPEHVALDECLADIRAQIQRKGIGMTVLDTESGYMRFGYARKIAEKLDAEYFSIDKWRI